MLGMLSSCVYPMLTYYSIAPIYISAKGLELLLLFPTVTPALTCYSIALIYQS